MPIFQGSRYDKSPVTAIIGKDGRVRKFVHFREPLTVDDVRQPVISHTVQVGEIVDRYPWEVANKPRLWWMVSDINGIQFPFGMRPGDVLLIPKRDIQLKPEIG